MLFTKYLRDGVRSGAITRSVRVWMSPRVRAGRRYRFEGGEIEVDSVVPITLEQITPRLARECGFAGVSELLKVARHGQGENVYLVESITFRRKTAAPRSGAAALTVRRIFLRIAWTSDGNPAM